MEMQAKLELAQNILGYQFNDLSLLWEALQAPGSEVLFSAGRRFTNEGNKPLAAIGDALLSLYIKDRAHSHGQPIGVATEKLKAAANNNRLAEVCDANGLTSCINGNRAQQGAVSHRTKSDTVEAVLGAAYKDGNNDMVPVTTILLNLGIIISVTLYTFPLLLLPK